MKLLIDCAFNKSLTGDVGIHQTNANVVLTGASSWYVVLHVCDVTLKVDTKINFHPIIALESGLPASPGLKSPHGMLKGICILIHNTLSGTSRCPVETRSPRIPLCSGQLVFPHLSVTPQL